jgi:hypothetical protein
MKYPTLDRTVRVDGVSSFYREDGLVDAFDHFHLAAPDHPGDRIEAPVVDGAVAPDEGSGDNSITRCAFWPEHARTASYFPAALLLTGRMPGSQYPPSVEGVK